MKYLTRNIGGIEYAIPEDRLRIFFSRMILRRIEENITQIQYVDNPTTYMIEASIKEAIEWVNDYDEKILTKMKEAGCDVVGIISAIQIPRPFHYN